MRSPSIKNNIKTAYATKNAYIFSLTAAISLAILMFYFTNYQLIMGNMGHVHANIHVLLQVIIALLFGINMNLLYQKLKIASAAKEGTASAIGTFLSILVSGCPACSITLASYLGLASILSALPFFGLELKVLGLLILLYSTYSLAKNLTICEVKN